MKIVILDSLVDYLLHLQRRRCRKLKQLQITTSNTHSPEKTIKKFLACTVRLFKIEQGRVFRLPLAWIVRGTLGQVYLRFRLRYEER